METLVKTSYVEASLPVQDDLLRRGEAAVLALVVHAGLCLDARGRRFDDSPNRGGRFGLVAFALWPMLLFGYFPGL